MRHQLLRKPLRLFSAFILLSFLVTGLQGCFKVGPNYKKPETSVPTTWQKDILEMDPALSPEPAKIKKWWEVFNDPILNQLITESQTTNYDIRIAVARVEEAWAQIGVVSGQRMPQIDVKGSFDRQRSSENDIFPGGDLYNQYMSQIGATWEIDLFGRIKRQVASAKAAFEATQEMKTDVMLTVYAQVAQAYISLRTAQSRLATSLYNIKSQREIVDLTQTRFKYGLASDLDVAQSEQVLAISESTLPPIRTQIENSIHTLSVLLGKSPSALKELLREPKPVPMLPDKITVGIPMDLIRRRPDIRAAERLLAAQTERIGIATSHLYPRLSIAGFFGFLSTDATDAFHWSSRTFSIGGGLNWNIFNGGSVRSLIKVEDARTKQALLTYEKTVLNALREVEDALVKFADGERRVLDLRHSVDVAKRTLDLSLTLYKEGLKDFQSTLDAERVLFDAENSLAEAEGITAMNLVKLYRALGGGWDPDTVERSETQTSPQKVQKK
ncbi:MAG: efflux transporter outer membrane subunit [Deltaproteobacteria bacterium]|nr:efflux transporter outer membrane subunit [Deltaproteobacteria bacterium]